MDTFKKFFVVSFLLFLILPNAWARTKAHKLAQTKARHPKIYSHKELTSFNYPPAVNETSSVNAKDATSTRNSVSELVSNSTSKISSSNPNSGISPKTGLLVNIKSIAPASNISNISITWSPSSNNSAINATIILKSYSNPALAFSNISCFDFGNATIIFAKFGSIFIPGNYNLTVTNSNGSGYVNFTIYPSFLNVTLSQYIGPSFQNLTVHWAPVNVNSSQWANLSIIRQYDNLTINISSNISDVGSYTFNPSLYNLTSGAYRVRVVNAISNGLSPVVQLSDPFIVMTTPQPANYPITGNMTVLWTPLDQHKKNVSLSFSNSTGNFLNLTVLNTGNYTFNFSAFNFTPSFYYVNVTSSLGSARASFSIYHYPNLNISSPNSSTSFTNATTSIYVQWAPFDISASPVNISLVNLNTNQSVSTSVANLGYSTLNLSNVTLVPGSYRLIVMPPVGSGNFTDFVIKSTANLTIFGSTIKAEDSKTGLLPISWDPINTTGGNVSISFYKSGDNSVGFGSISAFDTGTAFLNLSSLARQETLGLPKEENL